MAAAQQDAVVLVPEDDFDIDAVRQEWRGRSLGRSTGRYPVEHDPIRRYCHMTGERTPAALDPAAAADGPWGRVACPPMFVRYFIGNGPWPPAQRPDPNPIPKAVPRLGDRGVNLETSWEFRRAVCVGDRLCADWVVEDVFVKPTRLDPKSVWIATSATVRDLDENVVAVHRNTALFHRPVPADAAPAPSTSVEQRELPERAVAAFELDLDATQAVLQVSGSQDWNLVHHDPAYARDSGHESIFFNTGWTQGMLGRVVADYIGDRPWRLTRLSFRMAQMNRPGDHVTGWHRTNGDPDGNAIALELGLSNRRIGVTTTASAIVQCSPGPSVAPDEVPS